MRVAGRLAALLLLPAAAELPPYNPPRHVEVGGANGLAWAPAGDLVAVASSQVQIWNATSCTLTRSIPGAAYGIAWSPNGKYLATGEEGSVRIWDAETGAAVRALTWQAPEPDTNKFATTLAFSPNGEHLAAGTFEKRQGPGISLPSGSVRSWELESGKLIWASGTEKGRPAQSLAYSPLGTHVAVAFISGHVALLEASTGGFKMLADDGIGRPKHQVSFSPDGKYLIASGVENVPMWDVASGSVVRRFDGSGVQSAGLAGVTFTVDGAHIISAAGCGIIQWEVASGTVERKPAQLCDDKQDLHLVTLAFSHDGKYLAGNGVFRLLVLWDTPASFAEQANQSRAVAPMLV